MEEKTLILTYQKDSRNYHKFVLIKDKVIATVYVAKDEFDKKPNAIQVTLKEDIKWQQ